MKRVILILSSLLILSPSYADPSLVTSKTQIGYFIGSLRLPYSGIVTGIDFQSASLGEVPISFDARLESRGTFLALNPSAFDLKVGVLYHFLEGDVGLASGLGYILNARPGYDERSSAETTYAPMIRTVSDFTLLHSDIDLVLNVSLELALYGDGLSVSLKPQFVFGVGNFYAALDVRTELLARLWGTGRIPQDTNLFMDSFLTIGVAF